MRKISLFFIYLVSIFGAIDIITKGIKPGPKAIIFCFAVIVFSAQLLPGKRNLLTDIGIFIFAIFCSPAFSLFLSDMMVTPISVAMDCLGHKPSRTHYLDIILTGFLITTVIGLIFLKTHKEKKYADKILSIIFLLVLACAYFKFEPIVNLNNAIDKFSISIQTLPAGCK